MISGLNVGADDVQKLAALTRDLLIKLDLIDGNDPTSCILPDAIRATLRAKLAMPLARWYSGGQDIHATCGMLAGGSATW